jgi:uncharacterized protein YkwD
VEDLRVDLIKIHIAGRRKCVGLCLSLMLLLGLPSAQARETYVEYSARILAEPPDGADIRTDLEAMVLRATNSYRSAQKYPVLKAANKTLQKAARAHAMDLLAMSAMGHTSSTGHGFESRIRAFHQGQMILAPMAENAARLRNSKLSDAEKANALVQQWIKSAGHRKNMVNRTYTSVAIGVVTRGDDVYAVQIFSGPQVKTNVLGGATP